MKLYSNGFMPSPRRVRMFLAEKGLSMPIVEIAAEATQSPEFRAISPTGELPVLELDDGTRLTESLAICRYLEALHPEPPLLGRAPREAAEIEMWTLRLMFRLYVPATQVFRNTHRWWAGRIEQVPRTGELAREQVLAEFGALDRRLADSPFVAGADFSFADIVAFVAIDFGKPSGIRVTPDWPNLARWYEGMRARPSARA